MSKIDLRLAWKLLDKKWHNKDQDIKDPVAQQKYSDWLMHIYKAMHALTGNNRSPEARETLKCVDKLSGDLHVWYNYSDKVDSEDLKLAKDNAFSILNRIKEIVLDKPFSS